MARTTVHDHLALDGPWPAVRPEHRHPPDLGEDRPRRIFHTCWDSQFNARPPSDRRKALRYDEQGPQAKT